MLQSVIDVLQGQMLNLGDLFEVFAVAPANVVGGWRIYETQEYKSSMMLLMLVPASFISSFIPFQMRFRYV